MDILITSLDEARRLAKRRRRFTHAIQILGADEIADPSQWPELAPCSLRLIFDDILDGPEHFSRSNEFDSGCAERDIRRLLLFAGGLPENARILFHCHAGKSRSTAAALIVLATRLGKGKENLAAEMMLQAQPEARPNTRMIDMADKLGEWNGLLAALGAKICSQYDWREAVRDSSTMG